MSVFAKRRLHHTMHLVVQSPKFIIDHHSIHKSLTQPSTIVLGDTSSKIWKLSPVSEKLQAIYLHQDSAYTKRFQRGASRFMDTISILIIVISLKENMAMLSENWFGVTLKKVYHF